MGFIESNAAVIARDNTLISAHVLESCRQNGVERYFFASSACVYPEERQKSTQNCSLAESDVYPARPQDSYGREKLYAEECALEVRQTNAPSEDRVMHVLQRLLEIYTRQSCSS